jgi:hypothetical protein
MHALKQFPPTDPRRSTIINFLLFPIAYSIENPIIKNERIFQNMWKKFA